MIRNDDFAGRIRMSMKSQCQRNQYLTLILSFEFYPAKPSYLIISLQMVHVWLDFSVANEHFLRVGFQFLRTQIILWAAGKKLKFNLSNKQRQQRSQKYWNDQQACKTVYVFWSITNILNILWMQIVDVDYSFQ